MEKKRNTRVLDNRSRGRRKSRLAASLSGHLALKSLKSILLDGDNLREIFQFYGNQKETYDRANRLELAFRYGRLAYQQHSLTLGS